MSGPEIIVGVTGGISAYKSAELVSQLVQSGVLVNVVMTGAAQAFVGKATFAALSGRPVADELFDSQRHPLGSHITLPEQSQLLCIAPASANFLSKAVNGIADDLLSTLYLAFSGPVVMAPAMNSSMQRNNLHRSGALHQGISFRFSDRYILRNTCRLAAD